MTRTELIAALEAAEGPSRELDTAIHEIAFPHDDIDDKAPGDPVFRKIEDVIWFNVPHYTGSIDAALSFTPEGWEYRIYHNIAGKFTELPGSWYLGQVHEYMPKWRFEGYSRATPAIALCIANLRALEAQEEA